MPSPDIQLSEAVLPKLVLVPIGRGLQGPPGDDGADGADGPPGPQYTGDELPDMTLFFENQLI